MSWVKAIRNEKKVGLIDFDEVSMVVAVVYNMLDIRPMHGRSLGHDVTEMTYKKPHHDFGRIPIVIHVGDTLQPKPTANKFGR